jgi:hypothetical protein
MMTNYYSVAGHGFSVSAEAEAFALMQNYEPFACKPGDVVFTLAVEDGEPPVYGEELRQEDEGQDIICGKTGDDRSVFEFRWLNETAGWLVSSDDYREGRLITTGQHTKFAIDNALMVLYALSTAAQATVLFHAAIVSYQDKGYMFLGKSGTGKSTHARLWLRNFPEATLLNDDNPVVRIVDGKSIQVFGSPWSGKTPCYKNEVYPLGAIVALSQAKCNKINVLSGIMAYAAVRPAISGKRWDSKIADALHTSENFLAQHAKTYHLDCLPDNAAAILCNQTVVSN